jgi:hypothetical protein
MKTIGSNGMPRSTKQNSERWSEDFSYYGPETLLSRKRLASTAIKSDTADSSTVVRSARQLGRYEPPETTHIGTGHPPWRSWSHA